jgi:hypothetical protein
MTELEYLRELGKQVGLGKRLSCPICSNEPPESEQPMSSIGDFEEELFCPHCEVVIEMRIKHRGHSDITKPKAVENQPLTLLME